MSFDATVLKVLIASPGDTRAFRDDIERAMHEWNGDHSEQRRVVLLPRRWETNAIPLLGGDGQSVINAQLVDEADIVIGVFHATLGRPTARAASGTAEELDRSHRQGKPVHVYFATMPIPYDHDPSQFAALSDFKRELASRSLYGSFDSNHDLRQQVKAAITYDLQHVPTQAPRAAPSVEGGREYLAPPPTNAPPHRPAQMVTPLNAARQSLFAEILSEVLDRGAGKPLPKGSKNWVTFSGGSFGTWSLGITNTGHLRIEAYIDTGDRDLNKRLFDEVVRQREAREVEAGVALSWERLDDKKASRIAAYSPERVDVHEDGSRAAARAWAVPALKGMQTALDQELRSRASSLRDDR